jgi:hypothetical protein
MHQRSRLISATETARLVADALADGRADLAVRRLVEAVGRLIASGGENLPSGMFAEPGTTGDRKYDAVLCTAFLYAAGLCWIDGPAWTRVAPLEIEWLFGGDGFELPAYKDLIRSQTPAVFLERKILTRAQDWVRP